MYHRYLPSGRIYQCVRQITTSTVGYIKLAVDRATVAVTRHLLLSLLSTAHSELNDLISPELNVAIGNAMGNYLGFVR